MRTAAGLFDVSHMGEIETRGPRAAEFLRHLLSNDIAKVEPGRRAVLAAVPRGRRRAGRPVHLPASRPTDGEERFLTVVNASNADSDFDWFRRQADGLGRGRGDRSLGRVRDARAAGAARAGGARRAARAGDGARSASATPRPSSPACRRSCAAPATPARTASSCCSSRAGRRRCGTRCSSGRAPGRAGRARHAAARGLLPAVRKRPQRRAHADRGRPEVGLRARQGLRRRASGCASRRSRAPREKLAAVRVHRARAYPARDARSCTTASRWGRSQAVPCRPAWRSGSGWRTSPPTWPSRAPT